MLPKINRLKNTKEIDQAFKGGKGIREDSLFFKYKKNSSGRVRLAFIISKKVAKKAADRNKIKRRLREAVRGILPQIKVGADAVIVAQNGILEKNFNEIKKTVQKIIKESGLLK